MIISSNDPLVVRPDSTNPHTSTLLNFCRYRCFIVKKNDSQAEYATPDGLVSILVCERTACKVFCYSQTKLRKGWCFHRCLSVHGGCGQSRITLPCEEGFVFPTGMHSCTFKFMYINFFASKGLKKVRSRLDWNYF